MLPLSFLMSVVYAFSPFFVVRLARELQILIDPFNEPSFGFNDFPYILFCCFIDFCSYPYYSVASRCSLVCSSLSGFLRYLSLLI